MAKEYDYICSAHPVIEVQNREQKVYFTVPDEINSQTGLLLLVSGFGATPENNVYKKMRKNFAEEFNLVVVQTSYIGTDFMVDVENYKVKREDLEEIKRRLTPELKEKFFLPDGTVKFSELVTAELPFQIDLPVKVNLLETENNYVELGPIQAIDCINALSTVIEILKDNGYEINTKKMIAYGHSHGAYIALLANRFYPNLFSMVIDGGAWLFPKYIDQSRTLYTTYNSVSLTKTYEYRIYNMKCDRDIRNLKVLYKKFKNKANIIVYQGVTDLLINHQEKKELFNNLEHVKFNLITADKVDGEIFKSTNHADFDFVKLFQSVMNHYPDLLEKKELLEFNHDHQYIKTKDYSYEFYFENQVPRMKVIP